MLYDKPRSKRIMQGIKIVWYLHNKRRHMHKLPGGSRVRIIYLIHANIVEAGSSMSSRVMISWNWKYIIIVSLEVIYWS
jgi:hypothetical protein